MATVKASAVSVTSVRAPSTTERIVRNSVIAVQTGDCAIVRGFLAGIDDRVTAHAAKARDARIEELVQDYLHS